MKSINLILGISVFALAIQAPAMASDLGDVNFLSEDELMRYAFNVSLTSFESEQKFRDEEKKRQQILIDEKLAQQLQAQEEAESEGLSQNQQSGKKPGQAYTGPMSANLRPVNQRETYVGRKPEPSSSVQSARQIFEKTSEKKQDIVSTPRSLPKIPGASGQPVPQQGHSRTNSSNVANIQQMFESQIPQHGRNPVQRTATIERKSAQSPAQEQPQTPRSLPKTPVVASGQPVPQQIAQPARASLKRVATIERKPVLSEEENTHTRAVDSSIGQAKLQQHQQQERLHQLNTQDINRQIENSKRLQDKRGMTEFHFPDTLHYELGDTYKVMGWTRGEHFGKVKKEEEKEKAAQAQSCENASVADKKKFFEKKN